MDNTGKLLSLFFPAALSSLNQPELCFILDVGKGEEEKNLSHALKKAAPHLNFEGRCRRTEEKSFNFQPRKRSQLWCRVRRFWETTGRVKRVNSGGHEKELQKLRMQTPRCTVGPLLLRLPLLLHFRRRLTDLKSSILLCTHTSIEQIKGETSY